MREYWVCKECNYGVSGRPGRDLNRAIDKHEQEEGHTMEFVEEFD